MGTFFRFFIATPLAAIITIILFLGVYNQLTPRPFLYTTPEEPGKVYFEDRIICDCGGYFFSWFVHYSVPEIPDTDNTWTTSDKAVTEAPETEAGAPEPIIVDLSGAQNLFKRENHGRDGPSPIYPQACIDKGASGSVTVQYDITPEGRTTNIEILKSADECFNAEVLRAWGEIRFQPKLNAYGNPAWRRGVVDEVTFTLSE